MALGMFLVSLTACSHTPTTDERYRPPENILEVVAVLQRHVSDDTYRFYPARDFTGRNVYRASLLRLENIEYAHAEALRAGHMDEVLFFSKGRAFERISAYALAAENYRAAAQRQGELEVDAIFSADLCERFTLAIEPVVFDPHTARVDSKSHSLLFQDADFVLEAHKSKLTDLNALREDIAGTHYQAIMEEEIERADLERLQYFLATRQLTEDGDLRAVAEYQRLLSRHQGSKLANRHALGLADLFVDMAREYVATNPPEGLHFDPVSFHELVEGAAQIYEHLARLDGTPEKLEAGRRLEAFLAFTLRVDVDRFSN